MVFEGMHCAACALTIEDALRAVPGVESVRVSAATHRGRIVWSDGVVKPSGWMQAARRAGYPAVPANDAFANDRRKAELRKAVWRMGVAGLCMMQVMMYAWPAYVAEAGDLTAEMARLLRWASWVLTLPVMLFSCGPFFTSALRDLDAFTADVIEHRGKIRTTKAGELRETSREPAGEDDLLAAMSGHTCRCTGYQGIRKAAKALAGDAA